MKETKFNLNLVKPANAVAECTVCDDEDKADYCIYINCNVNTKKYQIKASDIQLPEAAPAIGDAEVQGWDKVKADPTPAKAVTCFSNYLKIGAWLPYR